MEFEGVERPTWDEYFVEIAELVAKRSTCLRRHVGAVLVRDKRILSSGYNGVPSRLEHCGVVGCLRQAKGIPPGERHEMCRGIHAEQNAIIQAALHGVTTAEATLYCTHQPCVMCAKILINAGITRIVYHGDYPDAMAHQMLQEAGIELVNWSRSLELA